MHCEICGREILGPPKAIRIEGVILKVCKDCVRFGEEVPLEEKEPAKSVPARAPRWPKGLAKKTEEELMVVEDFAERIRSARERLGWTKEYLAKRVGEKVSVIKNIESGKLVPTLNLARKLERALKITLLEEPLEVSISKPSDSVGLTLGDVVVLKKKEED